MHKKDNEIFDYLRKHPLSTAPEILEELKSKGIIKEEKSMYRILKRLIESKTINWEYHLSSDVQSKALGHELAPKVKSRRIYQPKVNKSRLYWIREEGEKATDRSEEIKRYDDYIKDIKLKQKQGLYLAPRKVSYGKVRGRFRQLMRRKSFKEAFEEIYLIKKCKDCGHKATNNELKEFYSEMKRSIVSWTIAKNVDFLCESCLSKRCTAFSQKL